MIDWRESMAQSYEYCEVDPLTWQDARILGTVSSAELTFDADSDTGGSASFEMDEDPGEVYIRVYLVAEQGGETERHPLGTFLAQTARQTQEGARVYYEVDAYTPLIELSEDLPPIGHCAPSGQVIMDVIADDCASHCRAPVSAGASGSILDAPWCAEPQESWLDFLASMAAKGGLSMRPDPMGRIVLAPARLPSAMAPVFDVRDDECSIVQPDARVTRDVYEIPNRVEVVHSTNSGCHFASAENDHPDSPLSTAARGRRVTHRETSPSVPSGLYGEELSRWLDSEARRILAEKGSFEREMTYTRGFVPGVGVGDCVQLDLASVGVRGRAIVASQSISCETGCQVVEKVRWQEVPGWI